MKTPRFAVAALLSALAAAPAFSQSAAPLTPIPIGPAASGQCVLGTQGCGLARGAAMDPVSEGALVGLGQRVIPSLGGAAEKKAPLAAVKPPVEPEEAGADLVALGGRIINPLAPAGTFRSATGMNLGASAAAAVAGAHPSQATFDTRVDGSVAAAPVAKASGLSYIQSQKVEATLGKKGTAFDGDPKLSAGDAGFGSGGFGASSNGSH